MGIKLEIYGEDHFDFRANIEGFMGLLAKPETYVGVAATKVDEPADPAVEVGANPSLTEQPKRRGRPAKPPVTIEATAEPAKVEEVAAGKPDPTSTAPSAEPPAPTITDAQSAAPAPPAKKPTIDEARTALKAVAALPNGQELTYGVLTEMGVKTLTEAYIKDAERLMTLCAAKMPVAE